MSCSRHASKVWEQEGFRTYVPLSKWSVGDETDIDDCVDEAADQWLAASPPTRCQPRHFARLFFLAQRV